MPEDRPTPEGPATEHLKREQRKRDARKERETSAPATTETHGDMRTRSGRAGFTSAQSVYKDTRGPLGRVSDVKQAQRKRADKAAATMRPADRTMRRAQKRAHRIRQTPVRAPGRRR